LNSKPALRKLLALAVTIVIVGVGTVVLRQNSTESPKSSRINSIQESDPERVIAKMLTAAGRGDAATYLDCFQGALRETLARRLESISKKTAATELRNSEQDLKNYVTTDSELTADDEITLVLERTYSDFKKRHRVKLLRSAGDWKIVELTPLDRSAPRISYGTPVFTPVEDSGSTEN